MPYLRLNIFHFKKYNFIFITFIPRRRRRRTAVIIIFVVVDVVIVITGCISIFTFNFDSRRAKNPNLACKSSIWHDIRSAPAPGPSLRIPPDGGASGEVRFFFFCFRKFHSAAPPERVFSSSLMVHCFENDSYLLAYLRSWALCRRNDDPMAKPCSKKAKRCSSNWTFRRCCFMFRTAQVTASYLFITLIAFAWDSTKNWKKVLCSLRYLQFNRVISRWD